MIKVSGCCDGCGKEADLINVKEFWRVRLGRFGKVSEFDFCDDCMCELAELPGLMDDKIKELLKRHGR